MLISTGLSIQAQESYPLRTSIDQRGEQTINRDAKTPGGIGNFSNLPPSILKWFLNRSASANVVSALNEMNGIGSSSPFHKELRPTLIVRSEKAVSSVYNVLKIEYVNPFGFVDDFHKNKLVSSGIWKLD